MLSLCTNKISSCATLQRYRRMSPVGNATASSSSPDKQSITTRKLRAIPLTPESFKPFGQVHGACMVLAHKHAD